MNVLEINFIPALHFAIVAVSLIFRRCDLPYPFQLALHVYPERESHNNYGLNIKLSFVAKQQ